MVPKIKHKDPLYVRIKKAWLAYKYNPKYLSLKDFWFSDFRLDYKSPMFYIDVFMLCLFSSVTLLCTRLNFLLNILFFYTFVTWDWSYTSSFLSLCLFCYCFATYEKYTHYINSEYGPSSIKKIGWNSSITFTKPVIGSAKKAGLTAAAGALGIAANSPQNPVVEHRNLGDFERTTANHNHDR